MSNLVLVMGNASQDRQIVKAHLVKQGYQVEEIASIGSNGTKELAVRPDLVVVLLPTLGVREINMHRLLSPFEMTSTLVLSTYNDAELMVSALDAGADDFMVMPFRRDEFLARVRALLRRSGRAAHSVDQRICIEGLVIDVGARRAFVDDHEIKLTRTEFSLLAELAAKVNAVCTHDELLARVWGCEYWDANHYLHVYLNRIRKKIGARHSALLETVPGMGYILHASDPAVAVAL